MHRPIRTSVTNATRKHQYALRSALQLLIGAITLAFFAYLSLFIGSSTPYAPPPSPIIAALSQNAPRTSAQVREAYGQLPLSFEANRGQADESVNFVARGAGYTLSLSPTQAIFAFARRSDERSQSSKPSLSRRDNRDAGRRANRDIDTSNAPHSEQPTMVLRMNLLGADRGAGVEGLNELEGKVNYFTGNDPTRWRANIPTFGRVRYAEVYPGIDMVYYGNQRQLEYDFVIAPGKDARAIMLRFEGADKVEVNAAGELLLTLGERVVRQPKPYVYQEVAGERRTVAGRYLVESDGRVGFTLGQYDRDAPLVIDPVLVYSTYLGGSDTDEGNDIALDSAGNAYICGVTNSTNFPTANAIQGTFNPPFDPTLVSRDGFVTKLNAAGTALVYSTYLGGNKDDLCHKIAVDASGNAYVAGETGSTDFPTANAFQSTYGGGFKDAFVTKLNAAGSALVYSTYIGGTIFDAAQAITIDSTNNVYITGRSTSADYPVVNPIQGTYSGGPGADAIVTKINAAGSALVYSTYLGGSSGGGFTAGFSIKVDSTGNAYVTGQTRATDFPTANAIQATFGGGFPDGDAFVSKLNAAGTALVYSTYLGGSDNDIGFEIALDSLNNAHVTGVARSANFPTANAFQSTLQGTSDAFVTKLNAAGTAFIYSTYLGGTTDDSGNGIAVDSAGNAYVAGGTSSTDFPLVNPTQGTFGGVFDVFLTKLNPTGSALIFSTYFGGSGGDTALAIAVDSANSMYFTGRTSSTNFPTLNPVQSANGGGTQDAFVFKLNNAAPPVPPVANVDDYITAEDTTLTVAAPGVLGNDTTTTGTLTAIILAQPTNGTVTLNSDGSFIYTPANNYNGADTFSYKANNGTSDSNPARVTITVNAVNDAPVNTVPGAQTTNRNTALTFSAANSNLISISDIDAAASSVQVTLTATGGTLSLSGTAGLSFTTGDGTTDATMTFTGTLANINAALNGLVFTPTTNFTGAASLQITTNDQGNTGAGGPLSDTDNVTINVVDTRLLQFSSATYTVGEAAGHATITLNRAGDTSQPASVDIATSDLSALTNCDVVTGNASQRCDYTAMGGTLLFNSGQSSVSFDIPIINDVYVEGPETLTITLSNPIGGTLGAQSTATLTIIDNDVAPGAANPIPDADFFIRMQYLDILNREPDPPGFAGWQAFLSTCPSGSTACDRVELASRFFRSDEFFARAYFIYRFYTTALGRKPTYDEYQRDLRKVTGFLTNAELEARKAAYAEEFSRRADFKALYDSKADGDSYVNAIVATAGVVPSNRTSVSIRQGALVITRGQALRELLESPEISARFFNEAFVVVGYFAYLRREPDVQYLVFLNTLNTTGNYREMIRSFIESQEYRRRFGPN